MNVVAKLSPYRPAAITLRDLVQPDLNAREERAIKKALKNAKKDQDALRKKARSVKQANVRQKSRHLVAAFLECFIEQL